MIDFVLYSLPITIIIVPLVFIKDYALLGRLADALRPASRWMAIV
jgi:hypothetical protein